MNQTKKVCQACQGYLFEEDDIVVCPVCGAPHHRGCYDVLGRCAVESNHGTENQYDLLIKSQMNQENGKTEKKVICPRCGKLCRDSENFCHNCSFPLKNANGGATANTASPFGAMAFNFDPYAGFSKDTIVEDDVTVSDVKEFVGINSHRYIPKFLSLKGKKSNSNKSSVSWNWAAFLFPSSWLFYRKMYFQGIATLILQITSTMCTFPLTDYFYEALPDTTTQNVIDYSVIDYEKAALPILLFLLGSLIAAAIRVFLGLFGNKIYKSHAISAIKEIKSTDGVEDLQLELARKGGVNTILMFLSLAISTWLPQILYAFL